MSGAYSTERIRTSKYSGSRAAMTMPAKLPFDATIALANTIVKLPSEVLYGEATYRVAGLRSALGVRK